MTVTVHHDRTWTVLELVRWTTSHFTEKGIESARLDAEVLLASSLGVDRLRLYLDFDKPVSLDERARFRELVRRRAGERVPVSQLVGRKEFWSISLRVDERVLTPRPETELLVEAALERLPDPAGAYRILDVGTGSGAIALALLSERPHARVVATDISPAALQIAAANAEELHAGEGVRFLAGSLFEPVEGEQFDLVVSNPPYLAERDRGGVPPELAHEPEVALFAGEDGLDVLQPLVAGAADHLVAGGHFLVELDPAQAAGIRSRCGEAGLREAVILRDLSHSERGVAARK